MIYKGLEVDFVSVAFSLKEAHTKDTIDTELFVVNLLNKKFNNRYKVGKNIRNNEINIRIENPIGDLMFAYAPFYEDNKLNTKFLEDVYNVIKEEFTDVEINLMDKAGNDIYVEFAELKDSLIKKGTDCYE